MTSNKWRSRWAFSSISNACAIRVTNRCDQKCRHCCFRSGPECVGQMSVKMCKEINAWIPKGIVLNIMGGEFTILDNYPEMLVALAKGRGSIRLITNGYGILKTPRKFLKAIRKIKKSPCHNIRIAVSKDRWHKKYGQDALLLLEKHRSAIGITSIQTNGESEDDSIAPVGRAWDNNISGCNIKQCSCKSICSMIITEDGMLCKCPFGYMPWKHFSETTWDDAQKHIWEWRSEKLADDMNCGSCMEEVKATQRRELVSLTS